MKLRLNSLMVFAFLAAFFACPGCARDSGAGSKVKIYRDEDDTRRIITIGHREFVGFLGPHGPEMTRNIIYGIYLTGPFAGRQVFTDPMFQDNVEPDRGPVKGTVTLAPGERTLTVDLHYVRDGGAHVINGTYAMPDPVPGEPSRFTVHGWPRGQ